MRGVVQRTTGARVVVDGEATGEIGPGVVLLVGIAPNDGDTEVAWLADKVANLRIFPDADGLMNLSLLDIAGQALVVSQFTLYGDARKGRRPSFIAASGGDHAEQAYVDVVAALEQRGVVCATGRFGADMALELTNDGPVTILLDSERTF